MNFMIKDSYGRTYDTSNKESLESMVMDMLGLHKTNNRLVLDPDKENEFWVEITEKETEQ